MSKKEQHKQSKSDANHSLIDKEKKHKKNATYPTPFSQFEMTEEELRFALVSTQYALRETRSHYVAKQKNQPMKQSTGLLVLVNGMELTGKGKAVTQLRQWVDPRLLQVEATIGKINHGFEPIWQKHTKKLPRHGDVGVYFGNWYADLIHTSIKLANYQKDKKAQKNLPKRQQQTLDNITDDWREYLHQQIAKLSAFEKDLKQNHTHILKCWFHIDRKTLHARLKDSHADPVQLYQIDWMDDEVIEQFNNVAQEILGQQDDWIIIDGSNEEQATQHFIHQVLHAMQIALKNSQKSQQNEIFGSFVWADIPEKLTDVKDHDLDKSEYKRKLEDKQRQLAKLLRSRGSRRVVFAFEGMDAAGKGGAIKRLVAPLDPREYQIYNIGAPMQHELEYPYLWRFWTKLPTSYDNRIAIFDRTWYGRVLVERIEGFADESAWQRAYGEINRFESDLASSGTILLKYWLAIDKEEQLERFEERRDTSFKQHKLTDEDWRNRDKWQDYVQSASDMLARTNTKSAPWCMVASNDKRTARLLVLDHAIAQLTNI